MGPRTMSRPGSRSCAGRARAMPAGAWWTAVHPRRRRGRCGRGRRADGRVRCAGRSRRRGSCRRGCIEVVRLAHRFRQVGLVPVAGRAAADRACRFWLRRRCRACRGWCSRRSRCGSAFLFLAIGAAGPVRHHRQAADRARAAVRRRRGRPVPVRAVRLAGGICEPAVRAMRPRRLRSRSPSARSGRAPRPLMWTYAVVIAVSRVVVTAHHPSDVMAGAAGRRVRRAAGAELVRGAPARLSRPAPRATVAAAAGPSLRADQKGCPAAFRPIRSYAATADRRAATIAARDHERNAQRKPAGGVGRRSGQERGRQHRAAGRRNRRARSARPSASRSSTSTTARPTAPRPSSTLLMASAAVAAPDPARSTPAGSRRRCAPACAARARRVVVDARRRRPERSGLHSGAARGAGAEPRVGLVAGQRVGRKATGFKKFQSRIANGVRGVVLRDGTRDTGCGLKAFRRDVFLALPYFDGLHRFLPALVRREGYDVGLCRRGRPRRACTARRTTACGTGCGSASSISSASGG